MALALSPRFCLRLQLRQGLNLEVAQNASCFWAVVATSEPCDNTSWGYRQRLLAQGVLSPGMDWLCHGSLLLLIFIVLRHGTDVRSDLFYHPRGSPALLWLICHFFLLLHKLVFDWLSLLLVRILCKSLAVAV